MRRPSNSSGACPASAEIWALIIAAEIGPFDRFPNADALEFWAGMTADLKESAGRTQSGNITKAGSATLRWALCQAAVTLCQSDAKQEATRQRFIARMPKAKANVAMGRRLLRTLYAMVRDGSRTRAVSDETAPRRPTRRRPSGGLVPSSRPEPAFQKTDQETRTVHAAVAFWSTHPWVSHVESVTATCFHSARLTIRCGAYAPQPPRPCRECQPMTATA